MIKKRSTMEALGKALQLRSWATPLITGAFVVVAGTGVLMFFNQEQGVMVVVHEWSSWLFLAGAAGHIVVNFRPLKRHLQSRSGIFHVAACTALFVASFYSWGIVTGSQLKKPVLQALVDAPLSTLASMTNTAPDVLCGRMEARGVKAATYESIRELAARSGLSEERLLGMVFIPEMQDRNK